MSGLYRRKYKDRHGKSKSAPTWTVEFRMASGRLRRLSAFRDKRASAELQTTVDALLACRAAGARPDASLARRVERLPFRILDRLREWGVLDPKYSGALKPLSTHLDDWETSLKATGRTSHHVGVTVSAAREIADALGWAFWTDVDASGLETYLAKLREEGRKYKSGKCHTLSARRSNAMLGAFRQFARWMVRENRAVSNPLVGLTPMNVESNRQRVRRAFRIEELRKLVAAAERSPEAFGISGPERALVYRLAAETGLRASELRSLTRASFDLDAGLVTVEAKHAKNRRLDTLPLRADTVARLRKHLRHKVPAALVFALPPSTKTAAMIRGDLAAAQIKPVDETGRVLDFHSLRATCATLLAEARVPLTTTQAIMRHSDPKLTARVYTTRFRDTEASAVDRLPSFDTERTEGASVG